MTQMETVARKALRASLSVGALTAAAFTMPAFAQGGAPGSTNYGDFNYGVCRGTNPACFHDWNATRQQRVLLYTRTAGPRHANLGTALAAGLNPPLAANNVVQAAIVKWGAELGYQVDYTEDVKQMNSLSKYKAVIFVSTSRDALWDATATTQLDAARTSLRQYIRSGGGFVGVHNAFGTEYNWPYYEGLLGNANFYDHGPAQDGLVKMVSPDYITSGLPGSWTLKNDEWYNLIPFPTNVKFLATVDEASLRGGTAGSAGGHPGHGKFHPVAWCQYYDGGKVFATTLGHDSGGFIDGGGTAGQVQFKTMIKQAIQAVSGDAPFCQ